VERTSAEPSSLSSFLYEAGTTRDPSVELVTVVVEATVQSPINDTQIVSDAFVASANNVGNGIGLTVRRQLAPNTTYVYTGNCTQIDCVPDCTYDCVCESQLLTKDEASTANDNFANEPGEIQADMEQILGAGNATVTDEKSDITTDAPAAAPITSSQAEDEGPTTTESSGSASPTETSEGCPNIGVNALSVMVAVILVTTSLFG